MMSVIALAHRHIWDLMVLHERVRCNADRLAESGWNMVLFG